MMLEWPEWGWNEGHFPWRWFWSSSSLGHPCHFESSWNVFFVIQCSFKHWMTLEWMKWCSNDYFLTLEWWLMTQMRVEWWNFWSKANALGFFFIIPSSFKPYFIIWHSFNYLNELPYREAEVSSLRFFKLLILRKRQLDTPDSQYGRNLVV